MLKNNREPPAQTLINGRTLFAKINIIAPNYNSGMGVFVQSFNLNTYRDTLSPMLFSQGFQPSFRAGIKPAPTVLHNGLR